jgi:hypothetical protein
VIRVVEIELSGTTARGPFAGRLELRRGLNVVSGRTGFGKTTAITAIPWCLGLEPMFGVLDNDPSRFSAAMRDVIDVGADERTPVLSSYARITLEREDGAMLSLGRWVLGGDRDRVEVSEAPGDRSQRISVLQARKATMSDETGGLQRFLFAWMGLPRSRLMTVQGRISEIHLENLAPLFFIDQHEGWTDLFALQVRRYGLQEIDEAAVELLLGANPALAARLHDHEQVSIEARLKGEAEALSASIVGFFGAQGWTLEWSSRGPSLEIARRWGARSLSELARASFKMDVGAERARIVERMSSLRTALAAVHRRSGELGPASQASQQVVELKTQRHDLRAQLRDARLQLAEQRSLVTTIEHRLHSSKDVLRLKVNKIGRLERVECPTCHRELDPSTFDLTHHSTQSVSAHVDALEKQRSLMRDNIAALEAEVVRLQHVLVVVDEKLVIGERALDSVNVASGTVSEALTKLLTDLHSAERELDALELYARTIAALEDQVKRWIADVHGTAATATDDRDRRRRVAELEARLRTQLLALGHGAVTTTNAKEVRLDERYLPYLGTRRLRSLGSPSDHPRLVAAYALALADAARALKGPHPGIVVLDEPQPQSPDDTQVELFLQFLAAAAKESGIQVIVTAHLRPPDLARLRDDNVSVVELADAHFLKRV